MRAARQGSAYYRRDMVQLPLTSRPAGWFGLQTTAPATVCAGVAGTSAVKRQAASVNSNTPPVSRAVRNGCSRAP